MAHRQSYSGEWKGGVTHGRGNLLFEDGRGTSASSKQMSFRATASSCGLAEGDTKAAGKRHSVGRGNIPQVFRAGDEGRVVVRQAGA